MGSAGANLSLVSGSIQEFTVIKDGFDPEYGDALSGIVKITTQTGSKDNTNISMRYMTDDMGNSTLNEYSRNYDYLRFKLSGPDPVLKGARHWMVLDAGQHELNDWLGSRARKSPA